MSNKIPMTKTVEDVENEEPETVGLLVRYCIHIIFTGGEFENQIFEKRFEYDERTPEQLHYKKQVGITRQLKKVEKSKALGIDGVEKQARDTYNDIVNDPIYASNVIVYLTYSNNTGRHIGEEKLLEHVAR